MLVYKDPLFHEKIKHIVPAHVEFDAVLPLISVQLPMIIQNKTLSYTSRV